MERFDGLTVVQKPTGKVVEKLGVARTLAETAEVARAIDDAGAEVPAPHPVHDDTRRQRVGRDGLC